MAGLNRVILTGRLTKDPEVRYTKEEVPLARFTVAVNEIKRKNGDAGVNYFNCVAWRGLAGICGEYLKKGSLVAIEGKMQFKSYESNGQKKQSTEVLVDNMLMLDKGFYKSTGSAGADPAEKEEDLVMAA
jgi:single-strand DNA-binding protein